MPHLYQPRRKSLLGHDVCQVRSLQSVYPLLKYCCSALFAQVGVTYNPETRAYKAIMINAVALGQILQTGRFLQFLKRPPFPFDSVRDIDDMTRLVCPVDPRSLGLRGLETLSSGTTTYWSRMTTTRSDRLSWSFATTWKSVPS